MNSEHNFKSRLEGGRTDKNRQSDRIGKVILVDKHSEETGNQIGGLTICETSLFNVLLPCELTGGW